MMYPIRRLRGGIHSDRNTADLLAWLHSSGSAAWMRSAEAVDQREAVRGTGSSNERRAARNRLRTGPRSAAHATVYSNMLIYANARRTAEV